DVAKAASAGAFGSFLHQGQVCMTTGRHLVHESIAEEYVAALQQKAEQLPLGDPTDENIAIGPVIDEGQRDNIDRIARESKDGGAKVVARGTADTLFSSPAVITTLTEDSPASSQEICAPLAPGRTFTTLAAPAEVISASECGLPVGLLGNVGEAMKLPD